MIRLALLSLLLGTGCEARQDAADREIYVCIAVDICHEEEVKP